MLDDFERTVVGWLAQATGCTGFVGSLCGGGSAANLMALAMADEDIGEIRNIVGFHIRLAHGTVYRHFTETFAELEMTQKQVSVLWLVDDHPDIAQTDLAHRMRMDRATTMAIVNRLQSRKYIVRGRSRNDGRKQTLNLTGAGRKALSVAKMAIRLHEAWLKSRFTEKEVAKLIEFLTRIHE